MDLIRCSLVYPTCSQLIHGVNELIDRINKGDTCLKRVVRIKNKFCEIGALFLCFVFHWQYVIIVWCFIWFVLLILIRFADNRRRASKGSNDWMYRYGDLTLSVLVESTINGSMSMVCEIQCLLSVCGGNFVFFCFWFVSCRNCHSFNKILRECFGLFWILFVIFLVYAGVEENVSWIIFNVHLQIL